MKETIMEGTSALTQDEIQKLSTGNEGAVSAAIDIKARAFQEGRTKGISQGTLRLQAHNLTDGSPLREALLTLIADLNEMLGEVVEDDDDNEDDMISWNLIQRINRACAKALKTAI